VPALAIGISADQAAINGKALTANEPLGEAALDGHFEQAAQQIAVAKAPVPVFREGRVVGNSTVQAKPAEPAVAEIEMDLFAQPALGADALRVADDQHADHQLGIDRWPSRVAVERAQLFA